MDRTNLRQTLSQLLEQETGNAIPELCDDDNLKEKLGLDSVDLIGLVLQVENTLNIRIETEELRDLATVGQMLDLVTRKLNAGPSAAAA